VGTREWIEDRWRRLNRTPNEPRGLEGPFVPFVPFAAWVDPPTPTRFHHASPQSNEEIIPHIDERPCAPVLADLRHQRLRLLVEPFQGGGGGFAEGYYLFHH
jgi:hypothetical protein